jgi:hypothetical protein
VIFVRSSFGKFLLLLVARGIIKKSVFQDSGKRFAPGIEKRFVFSAILRKNGGNYHDPARKTACSEGQCPSAYR